MQSARMKRLIKASAELSIPVQQINQLQNHRKTKKFP